MSDDLECPYCGESNEVCHDDGFGYSEDEAHEMECESCGKNFVFYTSISFSYSPQKADCLNGAAHRFSEWRKLWGTADGNALWRRVCPDCGRGEERREFAV
jgi:hypothetical protein